MKRFYKDVRISEERGILLDDRPVRTPARVALILPNDVLAAAAAAEWAAQGEQIDPRTMPITGLANAAIDRVMPDARAFAAPLIRYAETDLVCYRAEDPPELIERQAKSWDPILQWATARHSATLIIGTGITHIPQDEAAVSALAAAVLALDPWELVALDPLVTLSGSLLIGLAIHDQAMEPEAAFAIAHLDEQWQAEQWGDDDWAIATREAHKADFLAAGRFLELVRG
jgi:chaperone required for assembly of F1-ATPase